MLEGGGGAACDGSLVAAGVDGADILETEVPFQFGLNKGSHKSTAGSVHMDLYIIPLAPQQKMPFDKKVNRSQQKSLDCSVGPDLTE